jgi:hypothetical protein
LLQFKYRREKVSKFCNAVRLFGGQTVIVLRAPVLLTAATSFQITCVETVLAQGIVVKEKTLDCERFGNGAVGGAAKASTGSTC